MIRFAAVSCMVFSAACAPEGEPRPQWLVAIATDAPVPQFGDRLLVRILRADGELACSSCARQLPASDPGAWPRSLGVVRPDGGGELFVRASLFRADHLGPEGEPIGPAYLDALARLPDTEIVQRVDLVLEMACFGVHPDVAHGTSCDPRTGQLAPAPVLEEVADGALPVPGSWPLAEEDACPTDLPDGMVCIPGGAFLLGSPDAILSGGRPLDALPELLVHLPTFALDADEVTVGTVRQLFLDGDITGLPQPKDPNAASPENGCTFPEDIGDLGSNLLPVTCIDADLAEEVCIALERRLPTEAEWEYAAGNRDTESVYPWGGATDVCCRAVVARGRFAVEPAACRTECSSETLDWGAQPGGSEGDVTFAGVKNLAGNVAEWVADAPAGYDAPCWDAPGIVHEAPSCNTAAPGFEGQRVIRGSGWTGLPFAARAFERGAAPATGGVIDVGFRCAKSL